MGEQNMPVGKESILEISRTPPSLAVLGMQHSGAGVLAAALEQCGARVVVCEGLQALCAGFQGRPDPVCVHVVRNPLDVARAMRADRGFEVAEGLALWEAYNASALRASEGLARQLVSYQELLASPRQCLGNLLRKLEVLGVPGLEIPGSQALEALLSLDPDEVGQEAQESDEGLLTPSQKELWEALSMGRVDGLADRQRAECESLERALHNRTAQVAALKTRAKEQAGEIGILNQRVAWLDAQVMELQASSSWRLTAPLRALSTAVRKFRKRPGGKPGSRGSSARTRADATNAHARPPAVLEGVDTFVLYRIIGNDLHPRHKRGQAIGNLRFILEHEPAFDGCEKRFVINRILDADLEREIIGLLERAGFEYLRIPFDAAEYARIGFDTDILPEPDFLAGEGFEALDDAGKARLLAALYRHKNNYVMNNNGARNAALQDGRGRAKWILPWDGNCFLTRDAWERIRLDIAKAPRNRYFIVPMARMPSNDPLINGGDIPKAVEEPQIIFRADAEERFNPAFCYGRRPKVELLWRLAVNGPWDEYPDDPWDQERAPVSPESAAVGTAGWVARLSSGMATLEASSDQAPLHRGLARSGAILTTLQHLDARLSGMDSEHPVSLRPLVLRQEVEGQDAPPLKDVVDALVQAADEVIVQGPTDLQRAFDDSLVLALAWSFTGAGRYAERGSDILERFFVDPGTRVASHPGSGSDADAGAVPIRNTSLFYYLDAVRIFESAGSVGEAARAGLRDWLDARMKWMSTSDLGIAERGADDHRGTCYDLQVASIASFLDEHEVVYGCLMRAQARIGGQFAADGSQPGELKGRATLHRSCLNLQNWINLAELGSRWGVDLWEYRAPNGSSLGQGARWLLSGMGGSRANGQVEAFDAGRLQPIRFAAREFIDDLPVGREVESSPYAVKPVFSSDHGIRPFWNLASYGRSVGSLEG